MFMLNSGAVVLKEYTRFTTTGMKRNSICIAEAKKKKTVKHMILYLLKI